MIPRTALVPAIDIADLLASPIDRYLVGASYVLWVQRDARTGIFHTAPVLDPADFPSLARGITLTTHPALAARYDVLHDASVVRGADPVAFAFLEKWLDQWIATFAHRVRRVAVIRPDGVAGAALGGMFHQWAAPRFDAHLCTARDEAYDALAITGDERRELDALYTAFGPGPLRRVRDALAADLHASIDQIASRLGLGARSLQRLLATRGATFRDEQTGARTHAAMVRLARTDQPIEAVARATGFATEAALARAFAATLGEAPSAYRARTRRG